MKHTPLVLTMLGACATFGAHAGQVLPNNQTTDSWYQDGQALLSQKLAATLPATTAKNIILFVGDGMGVSTQTAARIFEGQSNGGTGEENALSFETFPHTALAKTYNTNQQTPDSAGTMTAMVTGVKTKAGVLSVGPTSLRAICDNSKNLTTFMEMAKTAGKATGIVSTARITHATPAATYAHTPERNWENDADTAKAGSAATGCADIATQLVGFAPNVALGGGRRNFIPTTLTDPEGKSGKRTDGSDLTSQWTTTLPNAAYVADRDSLLAVDATATDHLLGLFNSSHMDYETDRTETAGATGEPSVAEMTSKAIDVLNKDTDGYFLMVESGRIDHAHHAGNAYRALEDTVAFSDAIQAAVDKVDLSETLIIVTADHSHVFTIAGYPKRGNPILGKVVQSNDTEAADSNGLPYTTVGYQNGRGFAALETGGDTHYGEAIVQGRVDLSAVDTTDEGFHQEVSIPLSAETHSSEDVTVHALGAGSHYVQGSIEQHVIFHIMSQASGVK